jgi:hypothetical protein
MPSPMPATTPQVAISSQGACAKPAARIPTAVTESPSTIVFRRPDVCMSPAAKGPVSPKSAMLTAAARDTAWALQPISCSIGSMMTPGVERIPAATSSTANATPATTHA